MSWTPVDRHRPTRDRDAVANAIDAAEDVDRLLAGDGALIHQALDNLRTWPDTGVRAARANTADTDHPDDDDDRRTGPPIWCSRHHQDRRQCPIPERCPGEPYRPGVDPVGELATGSHDRAARARIELLKALERRAQLDLLIARIAEGARTERPRTGPGPGAEHCSSCYRWKKHLHPLDLRPGGKARFAGICRFCGEFRTAYGQLPPIAVIEAKRTDGMEVTPLLVTQSLRKAKARR